MIVIPPIIINDARLVSSTVAEPCAAATEWASATAYAVGDIRYRLGALFRQYRCIVAVANTVTTPPEIDTGHWEDVGPHEVAWNPATNYALDAVVVRGTTHRRYRCVIAGVDATPPESATTRWQNVGPSNRWAMFDRGRNLQTVALAPLTVVLLPGQRIDSVAVLGVVASTATVTMTVGGVPVYSVTMNLSGRATTTWYQYFFGLFEYRPTVLLQDLPPYAGATITVVLDNGVLPVRCSGVVVGTKIFIGTAEFNAKSDSLNFSKIERDSFGNSVLVPRRTVPRTQQRLVAPKSLVNVIRQVRAQLNAVPALWSALDDATDDGYFDALLIFGIYKQFEIDVAYVKEAVVTLELEEL